MEKFETRRTTLRGYLNKPATPDRRNSMFESNQSPENMKNEPFPKISLRKSFRMTIELSSKADSSKKESVGDNESSNAKKKKKRRRSSFNQPKEAFFSASNKINRRVSFADPSFNRNPLIELKERRRSSLGRNLFSPGRLKEKTPFIVKKKEERKRSSKRSSVINRAAPLTNETIEYLRKFAEEQERLKAERSSSSLSSSSGDTIDNIPSISEGSINHPQTFKEKKIEGKTFKLVNPIPSMKNK